MRVRTYRNLNNGMISIMCDQTKRIVGHSTYIELQNVEFKVNESGRQRVIRHRRKNAHAFAIGDIIVAEGLVAYKERSACLSEPNTSHEMTIPLRYNPYESGSFLDASLAPRSTAKACRIFHDGKIFATAE